MPVKRNSKLVFSGTEDSDSDDWNANPSGKKHAKLSKKVNSATGNLEEGEISSDALEDEEDDGLDENLIGGEDDKFKLAKMTEKEREEELFKRGERRDAMLARKAVKERLRLQKELQKNKVQKVDALFGSGSEEGSEDDLNNSLTKSRVQSRKNALDRKKEYKNNTLKLLVEKRNAKKNIAGSDSELSSLEDSGMSSKKADKSKKDHVKIYSDSDSGSEDETKQRRLPSSRSSSASSDNENRGRSRSPEEEAVSTVKDISRIRLSRFKLEKWVHMPFFRNLVIGCFVRINIGIHQGIPVYRCVEIADVIDGLKVYEFGKTRTNKVLVVKASKHTSNFRMSFVSNSEFTVQEFDSWLRKTREDCSKLPSLNFLNRKSKEIEAAISNNIVDDKIVEQIIQSKKRFQKQPTNYAVKKAELIKLRDTYKLEGNTEELRKIEIEIKDIDKEAERIERKRTTGFKSIVTINQRNRQMNLDQAEQAIRREAEESSRNSAEDPYKRVQSRPVIWTKKNFNAIKSQKNETTDSLNDATNAENSSNEAAKIEAERVAKLNVILDSLHDIHNFEIDISVEDSTPSNSTGMENRNANVGPINSSNRSASLNSGGGASNKRLLNLEEYKRRKGLI